MINPKDLEYLREMAKRSETEDFSNEQLQKISSALRTNVNTDDTTEALDLTAQIIEHQDGKNVDVEKLHDLTKEVIYHGGLLGAEDAIDRIDYFDFSMEVRKEHVTDENVNRESNGNSFLESSLYSSKSPETIKSIIDKGGKFREWEDPADISCMLVNRLTSDYKGQLEKYGENSIKNNLGNLAVLIETGIIEKTKDLDKLISNPELFEKYPDIMNKLFEGDKDLQAKLDNVKKRGELKDQKDDYLQEKLEEVRQAVKNLSRRRRRSEYAVIDADTGIPMHLMRHYANMGKTGKSGSEIYTSGVVHEEEGTPSVVSEEKMQKVYRKVADTQKDAAKEIMKKHLEEKHNR